MKTIIAIVLTISALTTFGQGTSVKDSILQVEAKKFIDSLPVKSTLKEFQIFLYENMTAKEYNEKFAQMYQAFLQIKYNAWLAEKKKKN
jgi:broad specificity phosphatase PhoE